MPILDNLSLKDIKNFQIEVDNNGFSSLYKSSFICQGINFSLTKSLCSRDFTTIHFYKMNSVTINESNKLQQGVINFINRIINERDAKDTEDYNKSKKQIENLEIEYISKLTCKLIRE